MAKEIKTFVFFDLEGTGLTDNPRITEMSFMAIHRSVLENASFDTEGFNVEDRCQFLPRVVNKLTVCMYPMKPISPEAADMTGLYNDSLLNQKDFDHDLVSLISLFLCRLEPPVCLVSHNGFRFDFPLLKAELVSIDRDLPKGLLCLDSWEMFRSLDGCPVLDRSQFMVLPKKSKKSKKSHFESSSSSEANKRKKKERQDASSRRGLVDAAPFVQHLFTDDKPATDELMSAKDCCSEVVLVMENPDVELELTDRDLIVLPSESKSESSISEHSVVDDKNVCLTLNVVSEGQDFIHVAPSTAVSDRQPTSCSVPPEDNCGISPLTVVDRTVLTDVGVDQHLENPSNVDENVNENLFTFCDEIGLWDNNHHLENKSFAQDVPNSLSSLQGCTGRIKSTNELDSMATACTSICDTEILNKFSEAASEKMDEICDSNTKKNNEFAAESAVLENVNSGNHSTDSVVKDLFAPENQQMVDEDKSFSISPIQNKDHSAAKAEQRNNHHGKNYSKKRPSYRLGEIHLRVVGCYPSGSHTAEDDCLALARLFLFTPNSTQWADGHAVPFSAFMPLYDSRRKHLQRGTFPSSL